MPARLVFSEDVMKRYLVLYNPLSEKGKGKENAEKLTALFPGDEVTFTDMTAVDDLPALFRTTPANVTIIFTGGDGTLNRVLNLLDASKIARPVLYYPAGTGNDFLNDLERDRSSKPFAINEYLIGLPTVIVNGVSCKFINGVGFGLEGFCCEESDRLKALGKSKSYTMIAAEGLFGKYTPTNATVTVDGETRTYRKVFMAPTMFGRFFGGGVKIAPRQDRKNPDHTVTTMIAHNISRLHALLIFLSVVAGKGERYPKHLDYRTGHHVIVEFDRPTAMQIDGETVKGVLKYEVIAAGKK